MRRIALFSSLVLAATAAVGVQAQTIDYIPNTQSYSQLINGKIYVASNYSKCADLSDARNVWHKYWCLKSVGALSAAKVAQLTATPAPAPAPTPVAPKPAPAPTPVTPAPTPAPSGLQIDFISNTQSYSQLINGKIYVASNYSKCADLSDARNVWNKYWCLKSVGSLSADKVAQLTSGGMPPAPAPAPGTGNTGGNTGEVPVTYTAKLNWTAPTTREDGAALKMSEIRGYEIYYTSDDLKTSVTLPINSGSATSHAVNNLKAGTYHFAISAIDANGLKSELSKMVTTKVGS
jgi:hypothetical protein